MGVYTHLEQAAFSYQHMDGCTLSEMTKTILFLPCQMCLQVVGLINNLYTEILNLCMYVFVFVTYLLWDGWTDLTDFYFASFVFSGEGSCYF